MSGCRALARSCRHAPTRASATASESMRTIAGYVILISPSRSISALTLTIVTPTRLPSGSKRSHEPGSRSRGLKQAAARSPAREGRPGMPPACVARRPSTPSLRACRPCRGRSGPVVLLAARDVRIAELHVDDVCLAGPSRSRVSARASRAGRGAPSSVLGARLACSHCPSLVAHPACGCP